jgi:phosphoglycolate phosphatase
MFEVIHAGASASKARVAIFDFDGTVSVVRSGWFDVMVPLCVEYLAALKTGETEQQLRTVVEDFVWRLTGKETLYQLMALADAIRARGGEPLEPLAYKKIYLERLWSRIRDRVEGLRNGSVPSEQFLVPGTIEFLEALRERGLILYLASGTDDANVKEEAKLLKIAPYFKGIYGAQDDLTSFSKALLVQKLISSDGFTGDQLLVVGDGYVEIEEVKKVGGTAVGVASAEPECLAIDEWKRKRLIGVGADFIVPNYLNLTDLLATLFSPAPVPA